MKTISPVVLARDIQNSLSKVYADPTLCNQYAWWCLESILKIPKTHLLARSSFTLSDEDERLIESWLDQLIHHHKPIQYLIGSVPFADLDILVEPPVLIPRPETEEWCLNLIDSIKKSAARSLHILDMCAGSGCIALTFAQQLPDSDVVAADIAPHALALMRKNAGHNSIDNISCVQSDVYDHLGEQTFDIIVSNPPYINPDQWQSLDASVREWEDKRALIADDKGYAIIKRIIDGAYRHIKPHTILEKAHIPQLVIEIGYDQAAGVVGLMEHAGLTDIRVLKDLEQKDRVVTARVCNEIKTK